MKNLCWGVLILLAACGSESGNIRGRIEELTCDTLLVEYVTARDMMANERTRGHDTLIAHNGRFGGNIAVEEPTLFTLSPLQLAAVHKPGYTYIRPEAQVNFMLDRDEKVRIDVKIEEGYVVTRMRGTQSNRDLAELFNRWNPLSREEALYSERIRSGEIARDSVSRETLRGYRERMSQVFVDFVRANPDSPIVGIVFSNVPEGQVEECGALLGEAARSSLFAPLIERKESQAEYRRVWDGRQRTDSGRGRGARLRACGCGRERSEPVGAAWKIRGARLLGLVVRRVPRGFRSITAVTRSSASPVTTASWRGARRWSGMRCPGPMCSLLRGPLRRTNYRPAMPSESTPRRY